MVEYLWGWEAIVINPRAIHKLALIAAASIWALTAAGAVTWPEAVRLLRANNNELRSARKQLESSGWTYRRSYTAFLPQLSANLSAGTTNVATLAASSSYAYGLTGTLSLFNASDIFSLRSAYADYQLNQANYDLNEANVLAEGRSAFIALLIAGARVDLQRKIVARRAENSRLIELRYEGGNEDRGNLLSTKADEAGARYNLSAAERDRRLAELNLSQLLGAAVASVEGALAFAAASAPDYETLLAAAPAYRAAKYQLEAAEVQQQSTLSEFLPSVSLSGSYRRSGSGWPPATDTNSLSVGLSFSFFPGGANFVDQVINNVRLDKAKEDFAKSVKDARYGIVSAYESLADALEALEAGKTQLAAATERANIAQEKYINGLMAYNDWYVITNNHIAAQSNLLNLQRNVLTADAAWRKSYGGYVK
ncbi:MAG: TolC family protein [Candidatus Saganbacteria bacterium]|nr:TolC family protein [Candidatus Saganbacteria bacterium]